MSTATLRSVGGSVVMAIPKRLLELVHLQSGSQVNIDVQEGRLVIEPKRRTRYTLAELMAQCDLSQSLSAADREWLDSPPVGGEFGAEDQ